MHLKRYTDVGLRVLMFLANQPDRTKTYSVPELSENLCWNPNLVIKVAHFMVKSGWIIAVRGRNGGIMLAEGVDQLRIGDIVRALENDEQLVDCADPACGIAPGCRLPGILNGGLEAFYAELNRFTLADLAGPGDFDALFAGARVIPIRPQTSSRPAAGR